MNDPEDGKGTDTSTFHGGLATSRDDAPRLMEAIARLLGKVPYQALNLRSMPLCPDDLSRQSALVEQQNETIR